jgi:predicted MFS family arabinose efflux permease
LRVAGARAIGQLLKKQLCSIVIAFPFVTALAGDSADRARFDAGRRHHPLVQLGFFGTATSVGWETWRSHTLRDDAEAGDGLQVVIIQFAITLGAVVKGFLFDAFGWGSQLAFRAVLLLGLALAAAAAGIRSPEEVE